MVAERRSSGISGHRVGGSTGRSVEPWPSTRRRESAGRVRTGRERGRPTTVSYACRSSSGPAVRGERAADFPPPSYSYRAVGRCGHSGARVRQIAATRGSVGAVGANRGDCPIFAKTVRRFVVSSGRASLTRDFPGSCRYVAERIRAGEMPPATGRCGAAPDPHNRDRRAHRAATS